MRCEWSNGRITEVNEHVMEQPDDVVAEVLQTKDAVKDINVRIAPIESAFTELKDIVARTVIIYWASSFECCNSSTTGKAQHCAVSAARHAGCN